MQTPPKAVSRSGARWRYWSGIASGLSVGFLLMHLASRLNPSGVFAPLLTTAALLVIMGAVTGAVWRPAPPTKTGAALGTLLMASFLVMSLIGGMGRSAVVPPQMYGPMFVLLLLCLPLFWGLHYLGYRIACRDHDPAHDGRA